MRNHSLLGIIVLTVLSSYGIAYALNFGEYVGGGTANTATLWHFNGNGTDSSGNGVTLTSSGTSFGLTTGYFSQGIDYPGGGGKAYSSSSATAVGLSGNATFTISMWMFAASSSAFQAIIDIKNAVNDASGGFNLNFNQTATGDFNFHNGTGNQNCTTSVAVALNTWTNVIVFHRGGTPMSSSSMLVNGKAFAVNTGCTNAFAFNSTATIQVACASNVTYCQNTGTAFVGHIDELIIDKQLWSSSTAYKYYTQSKGRYNPPESQ